MLKVYAHAYLQLGGRLRALDELYTLVEAERELDPKSESAKIKADELVDLEETLKAVKALCDDLDLPVSRALMGRALANLPKTSAELDIYLNSVIIELKNQLFLFIPPHRAKYYASEALVSERVQKAFPAATAELRLAGNCLATGCYTACVFHAMRAAEIGLRVLGTELGVSFPDKPIELAEWQHIIEQAESRIKMLTQGGKSLEKDADKKFYSQAAAQFRYFKDGWRIRVAHARESYDEIQATNTLTHACDFFETLAERMKE